MTNSTTYRMTINVQAWRVAEDGSLPEEAREAMGNDEYPQWRAGEQMRWHIVPDSDPPQVERAMEHYAHWVWYDHGTSTMWTASPGDWVVAHDFGVSAMSDEDFRACCTEVER